MTAGDRYDHGPLRTYEVTWRTGHIETVQGHQVSTTEALDMFAHPGEPRRPVRFTIHGDFPHGDRFHWRLVLSGLEDDVLTIRDVTTPEQVAEQDRAAGGES